ncbi:hypothetical protein FKP32DRAFT_1554640, partial [Trametes sanguinea]
LRKSRLKGIRLPGVCDRLIALLFADDTTVFLHINDDFSTLTDILEKWCKASGGKFNSAKTEVIPLGVEDDRQEMYETNEVGGSVMKIPANIKILRDGEDTRILGARLGNRCDPARAWARIVDKIQTNLERWDRRRPTIHGKRLIVNLEVASRTQFLTTAQGMPDEIRDKLDSIISDFIWSDSPKPLIKKALLYEPIAKGGIGLLDLKARNDAITAMALKTYLRIGVDRP